MARCLLCPVGVADLRWTTPILLALLLPGCPEAWRDERPAPVVDPVRSRDGATEFRDTTDLLQAIEQGTFEERMPETEPPVAETPPEQRPESPLPEARAIVFVRGTRFPEDQMAKLVELVGEIEGNDGYRIGIEGCSDPSGPEDVNLRISQARADSVAETLEVLGLPEARIGEVVGRGEGCEVPERVVHVTVHRAESAPPTSATTAADGGETAPEEG